MTLPAFLWNPIVAKEYRSRMRTVRSPIAMTIYILLLGGLGWAIFNSMAAAAQQGASIGSSNYGQTIFIFLVIVQMLLITFITPALTAGAISGERERQTIDLLFCTRIPPFSIIWGKLLASMSFVILLLIVSVPIFSLVFLFGGVELDQLLTAFLVTAAAALTLGTIGLLFSTLAHRTLSATVASYAAALLLVVGPLVWATLFPTDYNPSAGKTPAPPAVLYLSPIVPLIAIANNGLQSFGVRNYPGNIGVATSIPPSASFSKGGQATSFAAPTSPTAIPAGLFDGWQYWQASVLLQMGLAVIALLASALLLPPTRRLPWRRSAPRAAV